MHEHDGLAVGRTRFEHAHPDPVGGDEGRAHARKKIHVPQPLPGSGREQAPTVIGDPPSGCCHPLHPMALSLSVHIGGVGEKCAAP